MPIHPPLLATSPVPLPSFDSEALAEALRSLPTAGLVPAIAALVVGLLLWWFGERFLRLALMVLGVIVGVPLGLALGSAWAPTLPPLAAAVVGSLLLMILAAVGLRFAIAGGLAVVFGVAALLGTSVAIERGLVPLDPSGEAGPTAIAGGAPAMLVALQSQDAEADGHVGASATDDEAASVLDRLRHALLEGRLYMESRWQALPPQGQTLCLASGLGGAVIGFGIGMIFRRGALRLVTALLGSLLVVAGGSALLGHFAPDWAAANLPGGPWLGLWGVLAAVGGWLQWKRAEPSADDA